MLQILNRVRTWCLARLNVAKKPISPGIRGILVLVAVWLGVALFLKGLAWMIPLPEHALRRPSSTLVFDRKGQLLQAFISSDDMWRIQTPLTEVSPHLQKSLLAFEDRWFYWHFGVNPLAMARASLQNVFSRRVVSGGSTITMQISRMMEPKPRTFSAKAVEILRAFQLEQRYSKRQLLEFYYNMAPYGGNIEGVAAAAWLYFGKEPSQLSLGEAALLTALPNSPTANRPDANPERARAARDRVLARLRRRNIIAEQAYREALAEEVPTARQRLPRKAPHLCRDLWLAGREESRIYSTVDSRIQSVAEDLLRLHLRRWSAANITNGAVVVLDNRTHEVLALVGSVDFNDRRHAGQVNGARAPRSPGSALKPFIYALAMEQGLISPAHYVEDVPRDFSGYAPENYDRTYSGIVTARAALERSLNLPAITLEHALGEKNLYDLMRRAGVDSLRGRDNYGLSMAIGGCEITLLEISALYSMLACGGEYTRPWTNQQQPQSAGVRLLDEGTAYLITDVLTGVQRPDLPACWEFTSLPRVAWKTGTSYGHRDAWSIGYNPWVTVGVWVGNFSGEGARDLVGAEVAGPILFELMNNICRGRQIPWFRRPSSVDVREVCSLSGQEPGPHCPTLIQEMFLPDRSPQETCRFHQAVEIDEKTGYRLPPRYAGDRPSVTKVFTKWPARVGSWIESLGTPIERLPPLLPQWQGLTPGAPPIIRSPSQDCQYRLREGIPPEYQKICLEASAGTDVQKLYWFIDGRLLGAVKPGERLFYIPEVGKHRVVCQDELGRSSDFLLIVEQADKF